MPSESSTAAELEQMFAEVRRALTKARSRVRSEPGKVLREKGLYDYVADLFLSGYGIKQVQKKLETEHGVHVAHGVLAKIRQKVLGRYIGKVLLEELDVCEAMLDPLLNLAMLLRRVEQRYVDLVQMEKMLGVPVPDAAQSLLRLQLDTIREIRETLKAFGYVPTKETVELRGSLSVKQEATVDAGQLPPEKLGALLAEALARYVGGPEGSGTPPAAN